LMMPCASLVMNGTIIALVWFGGLQAAYGGILVGDIMALVQYVTQILMSVMMLSMVFVMMPRAMASADRVNEVLDTVSAIRDPETPAQTDQHGCLSFENVSFSYPNAAEPAVSAISFTAKPGETTAIIGSTGSGKTTLLHLILRFYDVDAGRILVDGVDIRQLPQQELRAKIGYVPQRAVLFSGTIAENIRQGRPQADDAEVAAAAALAQAQDFINEREKKLDEWIEQGGVNVSGGQKQRLSIARAVVRRPEIYLFDDSFSALDFTTDAKLRAALAKETKNATVLIVAQRVSTVLHADRILVLDSGELAGIGTHRELMESCAVYREIVTSQLSQEELDHECF
ncbi:MAG: ABC transporter ATP-binding protein, partial [Oscillospiraceae bacterium]